MSLVQAIVLGIVQGITEFLPVSSSGHLIVIPTLFGWEVQSLFFDVAVHVGTLLAVIVFFRKRIVALLTNMLVSTPAGYSARYIIWWIVIASIPAVIVGFIFGDVIEQQLRSPYVVVASLAVWGVVLWLADWYSRRPYKRALRPLEKTGWKRALTVGIAQAAALIPGTSRSGITITAGLFSGLSQQAIVEFSFLMSIPVIMGAALLKTVTALSQGINIDLLVVLVGVVASAISGLGALWLLWRVATRYRFWPFALYRLLLAGVLLVWLVLL